MDARSLGVAERIVASVDVGELRAGQGGDDRAGDGTGDRLDRLEVALTRHRESSFDVVDAEAGELLGDLELLHRVERDARRLLAVAKCRVEDHDAFVRLVRLVRDLGHREGLSWWWLDGVGFSAGAEPDRANKKPPGRFGTGG